VIFEVGDKVREGIRIGTVTDVGTMLIRVKTSEGTFRVVCPWELVKIRASHDGVSSHIAPQ
jgi:hypothetical protein